MDNPKSELLGTVETVSKFAGTLAGKVVVRSREISDCVKNMMTAKLEPKPKPSTKATESIKSQAKKKLAELEKEKPAAKQDKLEEKPEKPKPAVTRAKKTSVKPKGKIDRN